MEIDGKNYGFTQPVCTDCWLAENTVRLPETGEAMFKAPTVLKMDEMEWPDRLEMCCKCGRCTTSGIFIRVDPSTVLYPKVKDD
jgi:hypothetical protein